MEVKEWFRAPDSAPVKQKMMFASTKAFFKQSLDGIQVEMHCTDYSDLAEEGVREAIKGTLTRQWGMLFTILNTFVMTIEFTHLVI